MAEIGYTITAKLIEVLASKAINEICKLWNYEHQLENLKQTVSTIHQVFVDADAYWDLLNNQQKNFIMKLKDVVYDAEDVFDEFRTRAELNQLGKKSKVRKFFRKVRGIFSPDKNENKVYYAYRVSRDVDDIKERLDQIATEYKQFELKFDHKPIVRRSKETCSYIDDATKIIGRDKDKESIISMVLDPNVQAVTIVGMGGLGKTALAQLVFNDENIKKEFSKRLWVCVSDQERQSFDVKSILCQILESMTDEKVDCTSSLEFVRSRFQNTFKGDKYFLVLDDVWNEDREKWVELKGFLSMGQGGSKIIVTTRSEETGRIIGNKNVYKLDGLSEADSKRLFKMSAFSEGEINEEFVKIGEKILKKCQRNPLAIKVIGSLLFGQELSKWKSIEKSELAEINMGSDKIMHILKLSYDKLTPSLKSCFSYCAIFPKDTIIHKETLISLWMSHGYIVPIDGGQSIEEAAEEYVLILMRRCFFQDVKEDECGNVESFKLHDFMHDVAQEVRKEEICVVSSRERNLREKIRHVNIFGDERAETLSLGNKIRSCICGDKVELLVGNELGKLTVLRVLMLSYSSIKSMPYFIDKLLLLRYLRLKDDNLKVVPNSITRLYNLETLILEYKELSDIQIDFSTLINLRHLDLSNCKQLNDMPRGMDKLSKLRVLPYFVTSGKNFDIKLRVLQDITGIKGNMHVKLRNIGNNMSDIHDEGSGYLKSMKHLIKFTIEFEGEGEWENSEIALKRLEPPRDVKGLKLFGYKGTKIPWSAFSPQNSFTCISIKYCPNLKRMPMMSKLCHLKSLKLYKLDNLEYMENEMTNNSSDIVVEFFPSLESLKIKKIKKLKRWWKEDPKMKLRFPHLSSLEIEDCPNLISFAMCSNPHYLPELELPNLRTLEITECPSLATNLICPTLNSLDLYKLGENWRTTFGKLQDDVTSREVNIDKIGYLNLLPTNCITSLRIDYDDEVESLLEVKEVFQRCASTLQTLILGKCDNLSRLSGLEHLTALTHLSLYQNYKLSINEEDEEPWKSFHQSLCELRFYKLPEMKRLPIGMRHLTSLQYLLLYNCEKLEGGLPEWMSSLSSLQSLTIFDCEGIKSLPEAMKDMTSLKELIIKECPDLKERCKGEDFYKIKHIPHIDFWL